MNAAREKIRVARALANLPKISDAFRSGRVSYSKVRAMTRVANAENEDSLLQIALHGTAYHVETVTRGYRQALKNHEPDMADVQQVSREFSHHWDDDGSLTFKGRLPAEVGAILVKALESHMDQVVKDVSAETREPYSARRADALAAMAESFLAAGPASSTSADRYQVMLHVSADTSDATIENGPDVSAETSRRICCDAAISRLVEDEKGEPLSIGRKSRVIPPAMRRALKARDRQCRFPGCTHRYCVDGHHVRHWSEGGETSLDNLIQLCRHHHRLVHEGGFVCRKNDQGQVEFRTPAGALIPATGSKPLCFRGNVQAGLESLLEDRAFMRRAAFPSGTARDWT